MKKIVLLGDSIRMGYDKYVKEAFDGVAEVYYPLDNCRFAVNVLRFAHEWKKTGEWPDDIDLVHWNVGLWDAIEFFRDGPLTPIEYYEQYIGRVYKRLKLIFPNAKFVFATSTSVLESRNSINICRSNARIEKYNEAAIRALAGTDTVINDLYTLSKSFPEEYHSDGVHYRTMEGTAAIGGKVISVLCRELGIEASEVNIENFEPEKYSEANIGY